MSDYVDLTFRWPCYSKREVSFAMRLFAGKAVRAFCAVRGGGEVYYMPTTASLPDGRVVPNRKVFKPEGHPVGEVVIRATRALDS